MDFQLSCVWSVTKPATVQQELPASRYVLRSCQIWHRCPRGQWGHHGARWYTIVSLLRGRQPLGRRRRRRRRRMCPSQAGPWADGHVHVSLTRRCKPRLQPVRVCLHNTNEVRPCNLCSQPHPITHVEANAGQEKSGA